jgi:hypothetical protein
MNTGFLVKGCMVNIRLHQGKNTVKDIVRKVTPHNLSSK